MRVFFALAMLALALFSGIGAVVLFLMQTGVIWG